MNKQIRILVAEDDPVIGFLLGEVLLSLGYEVCGIVDSERGAVEAALKLRPDLMIVDARLGTGSGADAVTSILKHIHVPHIFMSGDTATLRVLQMRSSVLEKPFQEADLNDAIRSIMSASAS